MLLKSFWLPIRHARQVFVIFWPVLLIIGLTLSALIIYAISTTTWSRPTLHFKVAILWSVYFYSFFLAMSGLIRWHRLIILEEQPTKVSLIPTLQEIRYLARGILLFFVSVGCLLLSYVRMGEDFGATIAGTLEPIVIVLIVLFLCSLYLRTFVLIFPVIAMQKEGEINNKKLHRVADNIPWMISVFIVLALILLISPLPFLFLPAVMDEIRNWMIISDTFQIIGLTMGVSVILVFYGMLVFTTLLSLFYKEHLSRD